MRLIFSFFNFLSSRCLWFSVQDNFLAIWKFNTVTNNTPELSLESVGIIMIEKKFNWKNQLAKIKIMIKFKHHELNYKMETIEDLQPQQHPPPLKKLGIEVYQCHDRYIRGIKSKPNIHIDAFFPS